MLKYSSMAAYAILYAGYNDVDIYVEDSSLVGMYERIFKKHLADRCRVEAIIPLGSKKDVLKEAARLKKDQTRKRLFVVDGDFDWCHKPRRNLGNLYELKLYSIENFSFDDDALIYLAGQIKPGMPVEDLVSELDIPAIDDGLQLLVPLMKLYAISQRLRSKLPTVTFSIDRLMDEQRINLDASKIDDRVKSFHKSLCEEKGWRTVRRERRLLDAKTASVKNLPRRLIAGKSYGINFLLKHFQNKFKYQGSKQHFVCSLVEASELALDPSFLNKLSRL